MNFIIFILFYAVNWLLAFLPLRVLYVFSDLFYYLIYYLIKYRKRVVFDNLRNAFPEKSEQEIEKIAKKFYRYLVDVYIENIALLHMSDKQILKRVKFKNLEYIEDCYRRKLSGVAVLAHFGNWEWVPCISLVTKYKVLYVYKALNNKYFDRYMIKMRKKFGGHPVLMSHIYRDVTALTNEKELFMTGFIADQSPMRHEIQYYANFFNQGTPVYMGPEKIAKKTNEVVLFLKMARIKRGYYEVEVIPLFENSKDTKPYEITDAHVALLEKIIRENPEYWLWSHRRWKNKKEPA
jgi:Kdo2-lipid IVA lauroyltransferase/acyltransferase